jgi:hypothetical protein
MSKVGLDDLVVAGASAEDLAALPRLPWWPSLAPEALYGLAGRIVETVAPYTGADQVAVLAHLLVGIGSLIGSGPHALVGSERHPLRFYAALVGQSSKARKLEALRVRGPLTLTGLHATFGRHLSAAELGAALARLEATGQARCALKETQGRPAEVWEAIA